MTMFMLGMLTFYGFMNLVVLIFFIITEGIGNSFGIKAVLSTAIALIFIGFPLVFYIGLKEV